MCVCGYMACAGYEYVLASVEKLSTVNRGQSLIHRYDHLKYTFDALNLRTVRTCACPDTPRR